jgi:transposase-like protein
MLSKTYEDMNTFEQNEIDGVEAIDIVSDNCPYCKGDKVFEKTTTEGLQYGYICPQCQGTGVKQ